MRPVFLALLLFPPSSPAADWPHWRGEKRDGHSAESSRFDEGGWPPGPPLWSASVGEGSASMLVVGDTLFTMGHDGGEETVVALDVETGQTRWAQSYAASRYGRHAIGDQNFYRGPSSTPEFDPGSGLHYTLGIDGELRCWDTGARGELVWELNLYDTYEIPQRPQVTKRPRSHRDYGYPTSPLVFRDTVIPRAPEPNRIPRSRREFPAGRPLELPAPNADTPDMEPYRIGLLGLGTVGRSFVDLLERFGADCARAAGRPIELTRVVVRDVERARAHLGSEHPLAVGDDPAAVIGADDLDGVVELVGGEEPAHEWISTALGAGQDVITANKAVLAAHGESLFEIAHEHDRSFLFEGAVAGAIPILQVIRVGLTAGPITGLTAILNGSTNWLLGALERGSSPSAALEEMRRRGLVEADPTLDLSGADAAHKLALIARLITGQHVPLSTIRFEGVGGIDTEDLDFGRRNGLVLKLVATMQTADGGADLGVFPQWIEPSHPLASIRGEDNGVVLEGPTFGSLVFQGKGAGGDPTAGSVVADTVRAARGDGKIEPARRTLVVRDPLDRPLRHSVRLLVPDAPGVLAKIASAFATRDISLASVEQLEHRARKLATIHAITHRTTAARIDQALGPLADDVLLAPPIRIAIRSGPTIGELDRGNGTESPMTGDFS